MKRCFGLAVSLVGIFIGTSVSYMMIQSKASTPPSQAVAGVQTEILSYEPETTSNLVNSIQQARDQVSAGMLTEDTRLNQLARRRAEDMVSRKYYAHTDPDGLIFADFLEQVGLSSKTLSCENLLLTDKIGADAYREEWLSSPSHAACMLDPDMNRIGTFEAGFDERTEQRIIVSIYAQAE